MKIFYTVYKLIISGLFITFIYSTIIFSQQEIDQSYQYLSPVPGSVMNLPETNVIIKYWKPFNAQDILNKNILEVNGDKSGNHTGKLILAEKNQSIIYIPDIPFTEGENVNVKFLKPVKTVDDELIPALIFNFRITEKDMNSVIKKNPEEYFLKMNPEFQNTFKPQTRSVSNTYSVFDKSLPEDFPVLGIDSINNPAPGFIFFTPFIAQGTGSNYLIITDNYGVPVFYRKMNGSNFDFKKQPNGHLTYFNGNAWKFYVLDNSYNLIDSVTTNGYVTDVHELIFLENNHYLLMGYDYQYVRMDTIVPGGNPNALVEGLVIQELDENRNVVFQWRSFDHFQITDATYDIDMTDSIIDYVHANALDVDSDGNLLVSCRHMDEVTKINKQTGDIIWRFGGEFCENNQFTFINDSIGFSHQHYIRKLTNGNISLFDNGNLHSPPFSRVAEYQVDEQNKLAFLVWEYKNDPANYSFAMGSANRLSNHNTIIGWGTGTSPAISEIKADGSVALFITLPDTIFNYRAFKFPWKTNYFTCNPENLYFGYIPPGDSLELPLEIINNSDQQIEINDSYNRESAYQIIASLPVVIPPFGSEMISVKFKPELDGDYFDDLHLRWDIENQRIAQVVPLIGSTDPNFTSVNGNEIQIQDYYLSQNFPNPFNPTTKIIYSIPSLSSPIVKGMTKERFVTLKVYDILGREVATLVNDEKPAGNYETEFDASNLSSGIYFYTLRSGNFIETRKMVLLK